MFKKAFPIESLNLIYEFQICGTWGDPIMNKDIYKICEYVIKNSECLVTLNTNGSLRDEFWWYSLGHLCGDRLNVFFDVDGTTQEMHSLYRQNTNLQKILDNMKALSSHSNATVYTIKFKHNQDFIDDIQKLVSNYGCTEFYAVPSNRWESMSTLSFSNQKNEKFILEKIDD